MKFRVFFLGLAALGLSACAEPAKVENMAISATAGAGAPSDPELAGAVCVTSVTGGEETNALWTSEVDDASFRQALEASLANNGLSAPSADACLFGLEANLLGLAQPVAGFNMTVTSHVNYTVLRQPDGESYFLTTVTEPFTATVNDAFAGVTRLRLANEGSIRGNMQTMIDQLMAHRPG